MEYLQNIISAQNVWKVKNYKQMFILRQVNWWLAPLLEGIWEICKHWSRAVENKVVIVFQDYALKRWPSANILKQGVKICKFLMNSCTLLKNQLKTVKTVVSMRKFSVFSVHPTGHN